MSKQRKLNEKVSKLAKAIRSGTDSICKESNRCYFSRKNVVVPKNLLRAILPELVDQTFKVFVDPGPIADRIVKPAKLVEPVKTAPWHTKAHESLDRIEENIKALVEENQQLTISRDALIAAEDKKTVGKMNPGAALRYIIMESEDFGAQIYFGQNCNLSHSQLSKEFQKLHHNGVYWTCVGGGFYTMSSNNSRMFERDEILLWGKSGDYGKAPQHVLENVVGIYNHNHPLLPIRIL